VRFYDGVANVIEPQEHTGDLKEPWALARETKAAQWNTIVSLLRLVDGFVLIQVCGSDLLNWSWGLTF